MYNDRRGDTPLSEIEIDERSSSTDALLVSDPASPASSAAPKRPIPTAHYFPSRPRDNRFGGTVAGSGPSAGSGTAAGGGSAAVERDYQYSTLLRRVTVLPWPQRYNYYQRFTEDARRFASAHGRPCSPVPFFSYIPQYSQLSRDQLQFYFYFRDQTRARTVVEGIDFPYILLLIYEIINLPTDAAEGAETMAWLWITYRRRFSELDKYLAEWMCDFCMIHALPAPSSLAKLLPEIVRRATLKEFYLAPMGATEGLSPLSDASLILLCSDYSYRSSKYYEANAADFDRLIPAAVGEAAQRCSLFPTPEKLRLARAERDAYCGSLCAQTVKRRIRVEYLSFARSHEVRELVTQAVKLAENQLRRRLRISSRLKISLPAGAAGESLSAAIASFFEADAPRSAAAVARAEERAWQSLYDAPSEGIDIAAARALEAVSWENTELLVADESGEIPVDTADESPRMDDAPGNVEGENPRMDDALMDTAVKNPMQPNSNSPIPVEGLGVELIATLEEALRGEACRSAVDAAAINDFAMDTIGDVVLEECADGWRLIDDYREDVESWIQAYRK